MNEIEALTADRVIEGIDFSGEQVMIRFFDSVDVSPEVQTTKAMVITLNEDLGQLVDRVLDLLNDLVDEASILRRNPPKRFSPNEARQALLSTEDDDEQ